VSLALIIRTKVEIPSAPSSSYFSLRFLSHHHHYYCQHMTKGKPCSQQGANTQNTQ